MYPYFLIFVKFVSFSLPGTEHLPLNSDVYPLLLQQTLRYQVQQGQLPQVPNINFLHRRLCSNNFHRTFFKHNFAVYVAGSVAADCGIHRGIKHIAREKASLSRRYTSFEKYGKSWREPSFVKSSGV